MNEKESGRFLEGYYFLTYDSIKDKKHLRYQGYIQSVNKDETYFLCKFFSWICGEYTYSEIVDMDYLEECILFHDEESRETWLKNNYPGDEK